jgi:hypothetical protein
MDKKHELSDDILRDYINPELIERAPNGFTSRVMAGVHSEPALVNKTVVLPGRSLVPFISVIVIFMFILALFLLPDTKEVSLLTSVMASLNSFKISLPEIDFSSVLSRNLPAILSYVIIGILILSLLDKALKVVFHREK